MNSSLPNTIALPTDIWVAEVLPLLGLRELLALCSSSQALHSALTHKLVIRAALLRGGYASRSISDLINSVSSGLAHLPSPMRLLRISNGRRCESLDSCRGVTPQGSSLPGATRRAVHIRLGVFMCNDCVRVHLDQSSRYTFVKDYADRCGEMCGPIALSSFAAVPYINQASLQEERANTEETKQLVNLFREIKLAADTVHSAKRKREVEAHYANMDKKMRRFETIVDRLSLQLRDCAWREIALSRDDDGDFECGLVAKAMSPLLRAPSKATPAKMAQIGKLIRASFDMLYGTEFPDLRFLYSERAVQNRAILQGTANEMVFPHFLEALENYCVSMNCDDLSTRDLLAHRDADERMFGLVNDGRLVEAMVHRLGGITVFEAVVVNAVPILPSKDYVKRKALARSLWRRHFRFGTNGDRKTWREQYETCQTFYAFCCRSINEYLSLDWCANEARRGSIRRDRDLMERMAKVWFDQGDFWDTDFDLFSDYLAPVCQGESDFEKLLTRHKLELGRGTGSGRRKMPKKVPGQKDIRSFFSA